MITVCPKKTLQKDHRLLTRERPYKLFLNRQAASNPLNIDEVLISITYSILGYLFYQATTQLI